MPKIVILWSDVVVLATLLVIVLYAWRVHGSVNLRANWMKVLRDRAAVCASVVLVLFFSVAVVDSLHFRRALSSTAAGWVVSLNDPAGKCAVASSSSVDPMLVEKSVGGGLSSGVTLNALQTDNATAATRVVFDGFGRVATATSIARVDLENANSNFRPLRIQITRGGGVRLCEPRVSDTSDPRRCT